MLHDLVAGKFTVIKPEVRLKFIALIAGHVIKNTSNLTAPAVASKTLARISQFSRK
jgi:hypothetical protein